MIRHDGRQAGPSNGAVAEEIVEKARAEVSLAGVGQDNDDRFARQSLPVRRAELPHRAPSRQKCPRECLRFSRAVGPSPRLRTRRSGQPRRRRPCRGSSARNRPQCPGSDEEQAHRQTGSATESRPVGLIRSSGGETRTLNHTVNSRVLCQLSYPGSDDGTLAAHTACGDRPSTGERSRHKMTETGILVSSDGLPRHTGPFASCP